MNVLIIENNSLHLKLAGLVLSSAGYQARTAEAAEHVFNAIKRDKPQVILIDMELPDMDGLKWGRKLKASKETRDIRVAATPIRANRSAHGLLPEVVRKVAQKSPNEKS